MGLLEEMSWMLGISLLLGIIIAVIRSARKPPPPMGGNHLDAADGYFMNEWCDGD